MGEVRWREGRSCIDRNEGIWSDGGREGGRKGYRNSCGGGWQRNQVFLQGRFVHLLGVAVVVVDHVQPVGEAGHATLECTDACRG